MLSIQSPDHKNKTVNYLLLKRITDAATVLDIELSLLNLEKRNEINNVLKVTLLYDTRDNKIVKGYRYNIGTRSSSVMLLNKAITIDTTHLTIPIEFGRHERLPAAPIIRNDIGPGEYLSSYNGIANLETYVRFRDNYVCRHGLYIGEFMDAIVVAEYNMGIPVKFQSISVRHGTTKSHTKDSIIRYDKLGYPSNINRVMYSIEYKGPFVNGKLVYKQYPNIDITITKDIATVSYAVDMILGSMQYDEYIKTSPYKLGAQYFLYHHLYMGNNYIRVFGTLSPIKYISHDLSELIKDINTNDDSLNYDSLNYLKLLTMSEGPVKVYRTQDLHGEILALFDEFTIKNGIKSGIKRIYLDKPCNDIGLGITHECHSEKKGESIITIFWIEGKYVTREKFNILDVLKLGKVNFEDKLRQQVASTNKIPLGNIISNYLGYFDQ